MMTEIGDRDSKACNSLAGWFLKLIKMKRKNKQAHKSQILKNPKRDKVRVKPDDGYWRLLNPEFHLSWSGYSAADWYTWFHKLINEAIISDLIP